MLSIGQLFYIDNLSLIIMSLISFVAISIGSFSARYLKGDRKQCAFYVNLIALVLAVFIMVSADHILLLLVSWTASNFFLSQLMLHKREWEAAKQSSILAIKNFGLGAIFLGSSFLILYIATGETSVQVILRMQAESIWAISSGLLMILAAMTQSALWPFHRWLTSSSNSPIPVSAIMHAGLINGSGFLLARFAPALSEQPFIIGTIFTTGMVSALVGTLWKLMQSDVKRMLACSTMGQMGFMITQCGLGLFPAAVAHLCWHGLFKSYLFLASGSAAQEKRLDIDYPPSFKHFFLALIFGALGAYTFSFVGEKNIFTTDTNLFLIILAMITGTQFALPIIRSNLVLKMPFSLLTTMFMGALYGLSVHLVEQALAPLDILQPQPLNSLHLIALLMMVGAWIAILFGRQPSQKQYPDWMLKIYVLMLNASQPHPKTVTAHRNQYQF